MPTERGLASLLVAFGSDPDLVTRFNTSETEAEQVMTQFELNAEERRALLSHDVATIQTLLVAQHAGEDAYILPFGPVKGSPPPPQYMFRDWPFPVRFFNVRPVPEGGSVATSTSTTSARTTTRPTTRRKAGTRKTAKRRSPSRGSSKKTARGTSRSRTSRKKR